MFVDTITIKAICCSSLFFKYVASTYMINKSILTTINNKQLLVYLVSSYPLARKQPIFVISARKT